MNKITCQYLKLVSDALENTLRKFVKSEIQFEGIHNAGAELGTLYRQNLINPCNECAYCGDYQFYEKQLAETIENQGNNIKALRKNLQWWDKLIVSGEIIDNMSIERDTLPKGKISNDIIDNHSIVYWDFNIFDYIERGNQMSEFKTLKKKIFVYSPIHLEEVYRMKKSKYIKERIETISKITKNNFIYFNEEVNIYSEHPNESYKVTLKNIKLSESLEKYRLLKKDDQNIFWDEISGGKFGIRISNSDNVFDEITENQLRRLLFFSGYSQPLENLKKKNKNYREILNAVHSLIGVLDNLGYKRDNKDRALKSSIYDIEHITYASFCDYFVTRDKRLYFRAEQIYNYIGIETKLQMIK